MVIHLLRFSYVFIDSKTNLMSAAAEFRVADQLQVADDFFTFFGTAWCIQKKCFLKPRIDKMYGRSSTDI